MKKLSLIVSGLLVASVSALAMDDAALVKKAQEAGLKPIPQSKLEVLKLVDNAKNPMTDCKVELGKKLYFDPRLSKM